MADYTSVQDGDWSADATWGGSGYPSAQGDTFTIAHKVNYDLGDSTVKFGNGTINDGGVLIFPSSSDSIINFQDGAVLTVNSGGEIRSGTSLEIQEVSGNNHCYFYWEQGSGIRNVFVLNDGGRLNLRGSSDYYSGRKTLTLESAWDASAGDTLYVAGDQTSTWPVGAKFYLNKGYAPGSHSPLNSYYNDAGCFEIASIGSYDAANDRTPITVAAGHGNTNTYLAGQLLYIVTRNLRFADPNTPWVIHDYGTYNENLRFDFNQGFSNRLVDIRNALFLGWDYAVLGGYFFKARDCIFYANNNGLGQCYGAEVLESYFISSHYALNTMYDCKITGGAFSNHYGSSQVHNSVLEMEFMSNNVSVNDGRDVLIIGDLRSSNHGVYLGYEIRVIGDFLQNYNAIQNAQDVIVRGDFTDNGSNINVSSASRRYSAVVHGSIDGIFREFRRFQSGGDIKTIDSSDTEWSAPPSGKSHELLVEPNANCGNGSWFNELEVWKHSKYLTASDTTISIPIRPHGFTSAIADDEIWIEARYYPKTSSGDVAIVSGKGDGASSFSNDTWSNLTVTLPSPPGYDQLAEVIIYCTKYESGSQILIDCGS